MASLPPYIAALVDRFKVGLHGRFGERVLRVTLFGSYASGVVHEQSDVDLFVVIDGLTPMERIEVYDLAGELWVETGVRLSPLARSAVEVEEMRRLGRALIRDIDRHALVAPEQHT